MFRTIIVILTAFLVAGCVSQATRHEELVGVLSCCVGETQFQYQELSQGQKVVSPISETSPAFRFATGMSRFVAVRLTTNDVADRSLVVNTYLAADSEGRAHLFCPSVSFYDKDFHPIATELLMLAYHSEGTKEGGYWSSKLQIPTLAKYAALHTEARRVGSELAVSTGDHSPSLLLIGPAFVYYRSGAAGQAKYSCGHLGQLVLSVTQQ